ncbi:hypothetical protein Aperf_G00000048974 [Anoplocephala perfoliata]
MDNQQYQISSGGTVRRNPVMASQLHRQQQQQQQQQYQQSVLQQRQQQIAQGMALPQETSTFENPEGSIVPSLLMDQQSIRGSDPFFGSQPRGAMMQEVFIQGLVSVGQRDMLIARLRGLCQEHSSFTDQEESYSIQTLPTSTATGASNFVHLRVRRTSQPNLREYVSRPVLRYLGAVESTDRASAPISFNSQVCRRSYLEASVHGLLSNFIKCLGFKKDFEFIAEGEIFVRGRAKALVYSLFEVIYSSNADMQVSIPLKGRNLVPNSSMVEVTAIGSPADDTLQREVVELMELLHPLVIPGFIDHARLACR